MKVMHGINSVNSDVNARGELFVKMGYDALANAQILLHRFGMPVNYFAQIYAYHPDIAELALSNHMEGAPLNIIAEVTHKSFFARVVTEASSLVAEDLNLFAADLAEEGKLSYVQSAGYLAVPDKKMPEFTRTRISESLTTHIFDAVDAINNSRVIRQGMAVAKDRIKAATVVPHQVPLDSEFVIEFARRLLDLTARDAAETLKGFSSNSPQRHANYRQAWIALVRRSPLDREIFKAGRRYDKIAERRGLKVKFTPLPSPLS